MADENDDDEVKLPGLPPNTKNYMTPACYRRLLDEREHLVPNASNSRSIWSTR